MTIETRGTIELKDIAAVEYECSKCHAKTIRPLKQETSNVPGICANCQQIWFTDGRQETAEFRQFLWLLERYKSSPLPFILKFEVSGLGDRQNG